MKRWTDAEIIQAMRDWEAIFGSPPGYSDWEIADPEGLYPSGVTVQRHFGSWAKARKRAFPAKAPPGYWTRERIVEALRKWADEHGGLPPSNADLSPQNKLPSVIVLRRIFGSKAAAMKAAGLSVRPSHVTNKAIDRFLPFNKKPRTDEKEAV